MGGSWVNFARGVGLTSEGLALARALGGIDSDIVDLDRLLTDPWDFSVIKEVGAPA